MSVVFNPEACDVTIRLVDGSSIQMKSPTTAVVTALESLRSGEPWIFLPSLHSEPYGDYIMTRGIARVIVGAVYERD